MRLACVTAGQRHNDRSGQRGVDTFNSACDGLAFSNRARGHRDGQCRRDLAAPVLRGSLTESAHPDGGKAEN